MNVTIVLPTYNEAENIEDFLNAVYEVINEINDFNINTLIVDDNSPDGTSAIVKKLQQSNDKIYLLENNTRGLGNAYKAGFKYAIEHLNPNVLVEMDSDFSHSPEKLKELLPPINEGYDFVIGSRYIKGGSIPKDWALIRKLNSKYGNIFARFIAGLMQVKDCTSGFRAIKVDILKKIDLDKLDVYGYAFQMNILYECVNAGAKTYEIPINFIDRVKGKSKLDIKDVKEFMINSFKLFFRRFFKNKN
ncbi:polyprenol monophosphomannose synthase [bacterium]|nr:polyprenol monophosphomannose synthase [bacterium]